MIKVIFLLITVAIVLCFAVENITVGKNDKELVENKNPCKYFAFIHVGKNGGTTVSYFFDTYGKKFKPRRYAGHEVRLNNVNQDGCYVTLVRDPIKRWVSGYLSRYRMGCPAHCRRIRHEEWIWEQFPSPNHLAEAIYSENETIAKLAMKAILQEQHLREGFAVYLSTAPKLISRLKYVGLTCDLKNDLLPLALTVANISSYVNVTNEDVTSSVNSYLSNETASTPKHTNPLKEMEYLSPLAISNLKKYLDKDYEVMEALYVNGLVSSSNITNECEKRGKLSIKVTRKEWEEFMNSSRGETYRMQVIKLANKNFFKRRRENRKELILLKQKLLGRQYEFQRYRANLRHYTNQTR